MDAPDDRGEPRVPLGGGTEDVFSEEGQRALGRLLEVLRRPASAEEVGAAEQYARLTAAAVREAGLTAFESPIRARRWRRRVQAGALATALLLAGTGAAAAADALPASFQSSLASVLHHVGISLPQPTGALSRPSVTSLDASSTTTTQVTATGSSGTSTSTTRTPGPRIPGPELFGLCTAWAAHARGAGTSAGATASTSAGATGSWEASTAFADLAAAARAAGETVPELCATARPGGAAGAASSHRRSHGAPGTTTTTTTTTTVLPTTTTIGAFASSAGAGSSSGGHPGRGSGGGSGGHGPPGGAPPTGTKGGAHG